MSTPVSANTGTANTGTAKNDTAPARRPAVAWLPVGTALGALAVVLGATASHYGYHRDEFYFRMLQPAWGYVDQPPLTPLLARAATALLGDTVWSLRVPAMLCLLGAVLVAVLITREFGGGRAAQALCAWGLSFSALPLAFGHTLLTASLDLLVWAGVLLFVTKALLHGQPRAWLAAGAVVGLGLLNKHLVVLLLVGLLIGFLVAGARDVLGSPWLWCGVGVALLIASPNLLYQATHDWPQLTMAGALSERGGGEARAMLLPMQAVLLGVGLAPIWIAGLVALWRRPQWHRARAIAVAYPVILLVTLVSAGQFYYPLGLLVALFAVGCVTTADWMAGRPGRRTTVVTAVAVNSALCAVISLPVVPLGVLGNTPVPAINQVARDSVGWETYVRSVADVFAALPESDRSRAVLLTSNYGEAGALHRFGPSYHLPDVYSGHNELWFLGPPPDSATVVVAWTQNLTGLRRLFGECQQHAVLDNGVGLDNEEQGAVVAVCRDPVGGWRAVWPALQHYD